MDCLVPWGAGWEKLQDQITKLAITPYSFYVSYNASGYCTDVDLYHYSYYANP